MRRLVATVPTLFVVSLIIFGLIRLAPGDPTALILGEDSTPEARASLRGELGLDRPLPYQYIAWLNAFFRGDLGHSLSTHEPVTSAIASRLPVTLELAVLALIAAIAIGIPLGVLAALRRGTLWDVLA
ncbi:MAG: ABC transporter permease, partial [Candidatus Eremiobacteraeota bacterium]|nr:ABC transporter permease [Candidatus Eremiobacteraeota bacterium]